MHFGCHGDLCLAQMEQGITLFKTVHALTGLEQIKHCEIVNIYFF